ncbi:MAG: methionyl-tRNA formyltransferase [Proteobacteria bacterium]|nr:methionyl-tRNA formyltransferase [Alphaproteobacteria bacterium]MDA0967897.1 methionyl-tRNA formyltransferase [Pseudomonadota bacterium]MDA1180741.1 methionyl-tRNA formyltransferase [Pseudomonadota bacterium]
MKDKKIIFMGTPDIAAQHLNILIENNLNIVGVFTQPPRKKNRGMRIEKSDVHQIAEKNNIAVFHPTSIDDTAIEQVKSLEPDLIIVIAYGLILPSKFLNISKYGCINIHVSLLPRWRGAAPIEHALLAGDEKTGISVISISPKLDAGDILMQESFAIDKDINSDDLTINLTNLGKKTLMETLPLLFENKLIRKKQDENKVTYANKFISEDRKINFYNSSDDVYNHIRAHGPKPGSWFTYRGERIKIIKAKKINELGESSTILNKDFMIACKDGAILPLLIQREGKKVVRLEDFLRGFIFSIQDKLNA